MDKKNVTFTTYILSMIIVGLAVMVFMLLVTRNDYKNENVVEENKANSNQEEQVQENQNNKKDEENVEQYNVQDLSTNNQSDYTIVLYKGREINKNVGLQTVKDMKKNTETMQKYNIIYYNFEQGKYIGETQGNFGNEDTYEGQSIVSNVSDFAISKKYNATPRAYSILNEIPRYLNNSSKYPAQEMENGQRIVSVNLEEDVKVIQVDLDGDLRKEYIAFWKLDIDQGKVDGSRAEASSGFCIFDSSYTKIVDICSIRKEFDNNEQKKENQVFFSLEDINFVDIDEDGIMEIIVEFPSYEGQRIGIYKYNNGKFSGEVNYNVPIEP